MNISASIVVYDTPLPILKKCLSSFLSTSIKRLYVIDNSEDRRAEMFNGSSRIIYIKTPKNIGFGAANNIALKEAIYRFKYHIVANPDVYFSKKVIREMYDFMEANPGIGGLMPKIVFPNGEDQKLLRPLPTPTDLIKRRLFHQLLPATHSNGGGSATGITNVQFISGCFMFLRTSVLRKVGLFDERFFLYMEDVDLSRRMGAVADMVYYPHVRVYHYWHRHSYKHIKYLVIHGISAIKYFKKWGIKDEKDNNSNSHNNSTLHTRNTLIFRLFPSRQDSTGASGDPRKDL